MKMLDLAMAIPVLQKLGSQDLSVSTLYRLTSLMDKLNVHVNFYNFQRVKLLEQYCQKAPDGNYKPIPERSEEFNVRLNELMGVEIDTDGLKLPFVISESENIRLSYNDIKAAEQFIKIGGAEDES